MMHREPPSHVQRQQAHFQGKPTILERLIKNPRFPRTMRKKIRFVADALAGCDRILEVGTGHGLELDVLLSTRAPGSSYVGVDLATAPLRDALNRVPGEQRSATALLAAVVERLPFRDRAFNGIFCVDVLHHVQSQVEMLAELRRVLAPGGTLLCVEPNPVFPANVLFLRNPIEKGIFKFTRRAGRGWAMAAGFSDIEIISLPIFFPSFPSACTRLYGGAERVLGTIPGVRSVSTTRILVARRPAPPAVP